MAGIEEDDRVIIETRTDFKGLGKLKENRRYDTLKRGADMGIKLIKTAVQKGSSIVVVMDRAGHFEVLNSLEDCSRVFAGSKLHNGEDE